MENTLIYMSRNSRMFTTNNPYRTGHIVIYMSRNSRVFTTTIYDPCPPG